MKACFVLVIFVATFFGFGDTGNTIKKVHVIFRHGIRYPLADGDWYTSTCSRKYNSATSGNLTELGRIQMTMLGYFLRMRYNAWIGSDPNTVQMKYSDHYRDQESAELVFKGLFKYYNSSRVNSRLLEANLEGSINNVTYFSKWIRSQPSIQDFQDLCRRLQQENNVKCHDVFDLVFISDQFLIEKAEECQPPSWLKRDIQKQLASFVDAISLAFVTCSNQDMIKQNSDSILQLLNDEFQPGNENKYKKINLYAMHDTNVAAILTRIGIFNSQPVPFGAYLIFEEHLINGADVIRTFYNNATDYSNFHQLKVPSCEWDCPYDSFVKISKGDYPCSVGIHARPMLILVIMFCVLCFARNAQYL